VKWLIPAFAALVFAPAASAQLAPAQPFANTEARLIGGSMGGQETLLLTALHPRLLAGAAAFDPATDLRRRYYDFAALKDGRTLQRLAREEVGGTPSEVPGAYEQRSPDHYVRRLALSGVPLQIFWSIRDRVIADQYSESGALSDEIKRANPHAELWEFEGEWAHTAEMRSRGRLPRALARFGLLSWRDAPSLREVRPERSQPV
jgi:pimeloyl-ACP methyl ester carboxylesterase